jgi:hypothetical protein
MDLDESDLSVVSGPARFVGAVFGLIFLGIGLTVIGALWAAPGGFGAPPLIFRIVGSFIALGFVTMGGATAYAAISGKPQRHLMRKVAGRLHQRTPSHSAAPPLQTVKGGYACDNCGAALDSSADVSPHGDVKCAHCNRWFNVHAR